jgi:hypothetical protein
VVQALVAGGRSIGEAGSRGEAEEAAALVDGAALVDPAAAPVPRVPLVAVFRNAGHVDLRLAALEADPTAPHGVLTYSAARDRLEAAGFVVDAVERLRRAPRRVPAWLGGAAGLEIGRLLASDPDATVEWYVMRAVPSDAASQLAAERARAEEVARRGEEAAARAREVAEAAAAATVRAERDRYRELERRMHDVERDLDSARGELAGLRERTADVVAEAGRAGAMEVELDAVRRALREQTERAERAEAALAGLEQTRALRAAQTVWKLKARVPRP